MKDYSEVVKSRYSSQDEDPQYRLDNPVGLNIYLKTARGLVRAFDIMKRDGLTLSPETRILDIGCGLGRWSRFMAELTGGNGYIEGIDLSPERIEFCQSFNDAYMIEDITKFDHDGYTYDVITAMDVFMHLTKAIDIARALERINVHLRPGGYFIFYDAWAKDHWEAPKDADHCGFHPKQIRFFAQVEGFKEIGAIPVFRKLLWKYHSAYLAKWPVKSWFVDFLESSLPGPPGNFFIIFKKVKL